MIRCCSIYNRYLLGFEPLQLLMYVIIQCIGGGTHSKSVIFILCLITVYPKDRPVCPLTARVTISHPAFFLPYMVWGWVGLGRSHSRLVIGQSSPGSGGTFGQTCGLKAVKCYELIFQKFHLEISLRSTQLI